MEETLMSEPIEAVTPVEIPPTEEQGEPAELGEGGKKALEAERRRAAKAERETKALQERLAEIEAAKLTDLEKAQKAATEAAAETERARVEARRFRLAAKHGISDEDAELFLTGTDDETMTRQAERFAERTAAQLLAGNVAPLIDGAPPVALNSSSLEEALKRKLGIG